MQTSHFDNLFILDVGNEVKCYLYHSGGFLFQSLRHEPAVHIYWCCAAKPHDVGHFRASNLLGRSRQRRIAEASFQTRPLKYLAELDVVQDARKAGNPTSVRQDVEHMWHETGQAHCTPQRAGL